MGQGNWPAASGSMSSGEDEDLGNLFLHTMRSIASTAENNLYPAWLEQFWRVYEQASARG
jgi:hypothetical protein